MNPIASRGARYLALLTALSLPAWAQSAPQAATDDTFLARPTAERPNQEPAIQRAGQQKSSSERLGALRQRFFQRDRIES